MCSRALRWCSICGWVFTRHLRDGDGGFRGGKLVNLVKARVCGRKSRGPGASTCNVRLRAPTWNQRDCEYGISAKVSLRQAKKIGISDHHIICVFTYLQARQPEPLHGTILDLSATKPVRTSRPEKRHLLSVEQILTAWDATHRGSIPHADHMHSTSSTAAMGCTEDGSPDLIDLYCLRLQRFRAPSNVEACTACTARTARTALQSLTCTIPGSPRCS
jgi:hypothetical protein